MGRTKLAVLPEPVCAIPRISFPFRIAGIASFCMGKGVVYFCSAIAFSRGEDKPRDENGIDIGLIKICFEWQI